MIESIKLLKIQDIDDFTRNLRFTYDLFEERFKPEG